MPILALEIEEFRSIASARLELHPRLTVMAGPNGSGKTSLLEALFFLSCGRSFRTADRGALIRVDGRGMAQVVARVGAAAGTESIAGVRFDRHQLEVHFGGQKLTGFSQNAAALPVQIVHPEVHRLLEDGPSRRRRFLDWGVFHVEPRFVGTWRHYQRALRQRNAALKARAAPSLVHAWDQELVEHGVTVDQMRMRYLALLAPLLTDAGIALLGVPISASLRRGWSADRSLDTALSESWERDLLRGHTSVGPHRADLTISVGGIAAQDWVSRGQQKLVAAGMLLAQIRYHAAARPELPVCLMLDDPAAELDVDNLNRLMGFVASTDAQLIITTLDARQIDQAPLGRVFHVEQGVVSPMLY